ncbi:MAG: hypothetical protein ABMA13_17910 [Chthoniobacteraceae bacterium]
MKNSILFLSILALSLASASAQFAVEGRHYLFKASALFPVQIEKLDARGNTVVTKISLGTKELVNLALGRPINTRLNPRTEVLAVDVDDFTHNETRLVVYRPDSGLIHPICVLAAGGMPSTKVSDNESVIKEKGTGLGPGTFVATDPSIPGADTNKNSLQSTDFCASSTGSFGPGRNSPVFKLTATGVIGDIKGKMTKIADTVTTDLDGLIIKGMFSASGGAIFTYFEP